MAGSSIDPDLAASLKARDRHDEAAARAGRRSATGFSTLLRERNQAPQTQPASPWRRLRRALNRLSAN